MRNFSHMKPFPQLPDNNTPDGVECYLMTPGEETSGAIYPDCPCFLEDGNSLLLNTASGTQICHLNDGGRLQPLSDIAPGIKRARLAPDGRHVISNREKRGSGKVELHRTDLNTGDTVSVFKAEGKLNGTRVPVDLINAEAVSWDGAKLGALVYLDYDRKPDGDTGIVAVDMNTGRADVVFSQPLPHAHLRYSFSREQPLSSTLMFQHHHDAKGIDEKGKQVSAPWREGDLGVDLHTVRDDGTNFCDLPFGRDGVESCIGHQVWRGPDGEVASVMLQNRDNSYGWADNTLQHVVAGKPVPSDPNGEHKGRVGRDDSRHELSRSGESPRLCHLHVDSSGLRFAFDTFPVWSGDRAGMAVYTGEGRDLASPLTFRYILNSGANLKGSHAHPIISPDGKHLFFNSNYFGKNQAYMVTNLPWG